MVYVLLENGFEMCEALSPVDILRRGGVEVKTVGVSGVEIKSSHGVCVKTDAVLSDISIDDTEMLIIPGGQPGVDNLWTDTRVRTLIEKVYAKNIPISAICAAPIILARLGILDGKRCVCYPSCREELARAVFMENTGVAEDRQIITARAAGDAVDFSLAVLKKLRGERERNRVAESICYE